MNPNTTTEDRDLPLAVLTESATNPRRIFENSALKELAASIRVQGVLSPLLVRPLNERSFEIVAGARRYRAAQMAGAETVPVRIVNLTDAEALEAQLVENLIRADVHPMEEATGLADRLLPPHLFVALILGAGANCAVQCVGTLLRSFKHEPFLYQSLVVAVIALVLAALTAPRWGNAGASLSYLVATGGVALPSALTILVRARRRYLKPGILQAFSGEAA